MPICQMCRRYRPAEPGRACEAYPDGIPRGILDNRIDHRKPHRGDHGLQFVGVDAQAEADAAAVIAAVKS